MAAHSIDERNDALLGLQLRFPKLRWIMIWKISATAKTTERTLMRKNTLAFGKMYARGNWMGMGIYICRNEREAGVFELLTCMPKLDSIKLPSIWHSNLIIFDAINVNSLLLSLFRVHSLLAHFSASINSVDGRQIKYAEDNTIAYARGTLMIAKHQNHCILTLTLNDKTALDYRLICTRSAQTAHQQLNSLERSLNHCRDGCAHQSDWKKNSKVLTLILQLLSRQTIPKIFEHTMCLMEKRQATTPHAINTAISFSLVHFNLRIIRWFVTFLCNEKRKRSSCTLAQWNVQFRSKEAMLRWRCDSALFVQMEGWCDCSESISKTTIVPSAWIGWHHRAMHCLNTKSSLSTDNVSVYLIFITDAVWIKLKVTWIKWQKIDLSTTKYDKCWQHSMLG